MSAQGCLDLAALYGHRYRITYEEQAAASPPVGQIDGVQGDFPAPQSAQATEDTPKAAS